VVAALRCHAALYLHGHQVGGTNPSLVEALGAGNAVLAHDNRFNRWVAGPAGAYFSGIEDCDAALGALLGDPARLVAMRAAARARHAADFTWPAVLGAYERLLAG
jgi:glycosyltransferase involved in cell wall biosynthesis